MSAAPTSADVAGELRLTHSGPVVVLTGVDSLDSATPTDLAFCVRADPDSLAATDAGAVVCPPSLDPPDGETLLQADRPKRAFVAAVEKFFDRERPTGVHPTAVVEPGATVGEGTYVGPNVYLADCVTVGVDCHVGAGTVVGRDGFGYVRDDAERLQSVPHRGSVRIADDVHVGANCSIDRAVFEETVVERGAKLSGQVHLAHHVTVGADTTVACHCGIAGGAVLGERVTVHPHVSVANDVVVGDDAELGMNAAVVDDVEAGRTVVGSPATPTD